jgi:hypothetical protein
MLYVGRTKSILKRVGGNTSLLRAELALQYSIATQAKTFTHH